MKTEKFGTVEELCLGMKKLYESFGYKQFKMAKFEEYGLYLENKNFLTGQSVITFTDPNGKLMALKPDVTLSIVKNTKAADGNEKVYYHESVFRPDKTSKEFKEINQMGLEFLGKIDGYGATEVALLAAKTLEMIDKDFVLDVSHPAVIGAVIEKHGAKSVEREVLAFASSKNGHDLKRLCQEHGLPLSLADEVSCLAEGLGGVEKTLAKAREFAGDCLAVQELAELFSAFEKMGFKDKIRLDFSLTADPDYYSGAVLEGYVSKCPRAVLTGGRYDKLAEKYAAGVGAMGFAVDLNEIAPYFGGAKEYDADVFLRYGAGAEPAEVFKAAARIAESGKSVVAGAEMPCGAKFRETMDLQVK